jgi:5-methylcytosine-specific restriction enzyme subunit McrC
VSARVRRLYGKLDQVSDVRISRRDFGRVQLQRNNSGYHFALRVCLLIHENLMVDDGMVARSWDFRADAQQMGAVFELFVFNFFRIEQRRFRISRPHIAWHAAEGSDADLLRLPRMRTDVVLEADARCIILDTKFYADALKGRFESKKVDSGHLYQIFSYVENRSASRANTPPHEGMLLYPAVDDAFAFDYRLNGNRIAIRSIDLDQPWAHVHADLLGVIA